MYLFPSESNEVDHTFFSASFFRMTNARDYRISYQDVMLRNTTDLSTAEQNSLVMRERFGDISGNNNWLRCKLHNSFVQHCVALPLRSPWLVLFSSVQLVYPIMVRARSPWSHFSTLEETCLPLISTKKPPVSLRNFWLAS